MSFQYPLPLGFAPRLDEEDFFVSDSNRQAVEDLFRFDVFIVVGPQGCGKTHLARIWQNRFSGIALTPESLTETFLGDGVIAANALVLDDLQHFKEEPLLFHLLNIVRESRKKLLMTCSQVPDRTLFQLPDLLSRLRSYPFATIFPPDDQLLMALLVKQFQDLHMTIPHELLPYVLKRIHRSFGAIRSFVQRMDELSLSQKRPMTIALAKKALEEVEEERGV